jgi:hypothetical protein
VPPLSRANIEQTYFDQEFGAFFRINTGWISPFYEDQAWNDIFSKPYLQLMYYLQIAIEQDISQVNGHNYTINDFCYKPITGEGCLEESPMGYFQMNLTTLMDPNTNVKETAQCIPPPDATSRICFDQIGTPMLTYAVFGGISCEAGTSGECQACLIDAPAF